MYVFCVDLKDPEKIFIIIIANGIKQASVLYLKEICCTFVCDLAFVPVNIGKAS